MCHGVVPMADAETEWAWYVEAVRLAQRRASDCRRPGRWPAGDALGGHRAQTLDLAAAQPQRSGSAGKAVDVLLDPGAQMGERYT